MSSSPVSFYEYQPAELLLEYSEPARQRTPEPFIVILLVMPHARPAQARNFPRHACLPAQSIEERSPVTAVIAAPQISLRRRTDAPE